MGRRGKSEKEIDLVGISHQREDTFTFPRQASSLTCCFSSWREFIPGAVRRGRDRGEGRERENQEEQATSLHRKA